MGKFEDYTEKAKPEDADIMVMKDVAGKATKKIKFGGVWDWIVDKMANAVIARLTTQNKTLLGAIDELNSKSSICGFSLSSPGWYRIAKYEASSKSGAYGSEGYGCLIQINSVFHNDTTIFRLISFAAGYTISKFDILSSYVTSAALTKIRHTVDENTNTAYIEVYYGAKLINSFGFSCLCNVNGYGNTGVWKNAGAQPTQESIQGVAVVSAINL